MDKTKAPFTDDQVIVINRYQTHSKFHEYTCCSPESIPNCLRACKEVNGEVIKGTSNGTLVATKEGLVCPCGEYKQTWVYKLTDRLIKKQDLLNLGFVHYPKDPFVGNCYIKKTGVMYETFHGPSEKYFLYLPSNKHVYYCSTEKAEVILVRELETFINKHL